MAKMFSNISILKSNIIIQYPGVTFKDLLQIFGMKKWNYLLQLAIAEYLNNIVPIKYKTKPYGKEEGVTFI